jgi:predicted RNase H-like nuclease (RuvC/YqgF family)
MENFREKRLERQLKSQQTTSIVIGIILVLSIIGNVFLLVRNSRLAGEAEDVAQARDVAVAERQTAEERIDQLESEIGSLEQQVSELRETASSLEGQLQTRNRQIAQLRRQFPEMEEELERHVADLQQLEEEYQALQEEREGLMDKLASLEQEISELRKEYEAQTALIEEATYLQAYNISVVNLRDRWLWGRPVYMEDAGRVSRTLVSFEINSNILVEPARKDVHLLMYNPEGEVINPSTDSFTVAETGAAFNYTEHEAIDYEQQRVALDFEIEHDDRLESGTYRLEVYIDGQLAGGKEFILD